MFEHINLSTSPVARVHNLGRIRAIFSVDTTHLSISYRHDSCTLGIRLVIIRYCAHLNATRSGPDLGQDCHFRRAEALPIGWYALASACFVHQICTVLAAMLCLQVAFACTGTVNLNSFGGWPNSESNAVFCEAGNGNGQGFVISNPDEEDLQWYWVTHTQFLNWLNGDKWEYMIQGSQDTTTTETQAVAVAEQCPEDLCVLLFYCMNLVESCKNIVWTRYEGEFSSAPCAQSAPIMCNSLPSTGACYSNDAEYDCDGSSYGKDCCVNTMSYGNINGEAVCMDSNDDPLPQLCNILTLEPGYSASPTPAPYVPPPSPSSIPHQDDYHPYEPSPSPEWQPSASASPASYAPSGQQPSDGPGLFSPGPVLYGIIGIGLLVVGVIVVGVVRARRRARQATTERALPLLSPQAVQRR